MFGAQESSIAPKIYKASRLLRAPQLPVARLQVQEPETIGTAPELNLDPPTRDPSEAEQEADADGEIREGDSRRGAAETVHMRAGSQGVTRDTTS